MDGLKEGGDVLRGMDKVLGYFPDLTETQQEQLSALGGLYTYWNARINVISRKDIGYMYVRHVLHSLALAKVLTLKVGAEVLDLGTGGGFPGVPLAIMFPEVHFLLVDSVGKKIKVVKEICESLGLKNVTVVCDRAEHLSGTYDFVMSRAVASLAKLRGWVKGKLKKKSVHKQKNGLWCWKGGDISAELLEARVGDRVKVYDIEELFAGEDFFCEKRLVHVW